MEVVADLPTINHELRFEKPHVSLPTGVPSKTTGIMGECLRLNFTLSWMPAYACQIKTDFSLVFLL